MRSRHSTTGRSPGLTMAGVGLLVIGLAGCPPAPPRMEPPLLLSRDEAVRLVNENARSLRHGLRSRGMQVRAELVYEGQRRHFDFRGLLTFVRPRYLFFQLNHLAQTAMKIGSNDQEYWVYVIPEVNKMWLGRWDELRVSRLDPIPVHPDHLIESLGLNELPTSGSAGGPFFAVHDDRNRLVFVDPYGRRGAYVTKEYWLDRRAPFLIRRIVFRWPDGTVAMRSMLEDYQPLVTGTMVARHIRVEWPEKDGFMDFRLGTTDDWERLGPEHPTFRRPSGAESIEELGAGL